MNTIPIVVWSLWTALLSPPSWISWYPTTSPSPWLAPFCPLPPWLGCDSFSPALSLHTGASSCLLHTSWQHWRPTSLRALPTSPLPGAPRCLASLDLHLRLAPYCSSACILLPISPCWGFVLPPTYPSAALGFDQPAGLAHLSPHPGLPHASPPWASTLMVPLFHSSF